MGVDVAKKKRHEETVVRQKEYDLNRKAFTTCLRLICLENACRITEAKKIFNALPESDRSLRMSLARTMVMPSDDVIAQIMYQLCNGLNAAGVPARIEVSKDNRIQVEVKGRRVSFFSAEALFTVRGAGEEFWLDSGAGVIDEFKEVANDH